MVGMGYERKNTMFDYVEDKVSLKRAQSASSSIVKELEEVLRDEYGINSQFFLVGSGARNMVTQNADEPIDFDYNLNVFDGFDYEERDLKQDIHKALNKVMRNKELRDVQDSTSSLTTYALNFTDKSDFQFCIDICIVTKDKEGFWHRLKHDKTGFSYNDKYFWNKAPNSNKYAAKAEKIKSVPGWWEVVRQRYLTIKNEYLQNNDHDHPSFVCYIQAVNDVYNHMKQIKII